MFSVIATAKGRHIHLSADCSTLWQGWVNSLSAGNDVWATDSISMDDAELAGKWCCKRCFRNAGIEIPDNMNSTLVKAARRKARADKARGIAQIEANLGE